MPDNKDSILKKINQGAAQEVAPVNDILARINAGQAQEVEGGPGDTPKKKEAGGPSVSSPRPTPLVSDGSDVPEDWLSKATFGVLSSAPKPEKGIAPYSSVIGPNAERIVSDKLAAGGADDRQIRTGVGLLKSSEDPVAGLAKAALFDQKTREFRDRQRAEVERNMQSGAFDSLLASGITIPAEAQPKQEIPSELEVAARRAARPTQDVLVNPPQLAQAKEVSDLRDSQEEERIVEAERPTYFSTGSVADLYKAENDLAEQFLGQKLPTDLLASRAQKSKEMDAAVNVMDNLNPTDKAKFVEDLDKAIADGERAVELSSDPEMQIDAEAARTKLAYLKELKGFAQQKYDRYSQPVIDNFVRGYVKQIQQGRLNGTYTPNFEFNPVDNVLGRQYDFTASPTAEFKTEQQDKIRDDIEAFIKNNPQGAYLTARDKNFIVREILNNYQVQGKIQTDLINKFEEEGGLSPEELAAFRAGNVIAGVGDEWGEIANRVADYRKQLIAANPNLSDPNPQQAIELDNALSKFQKQQVYQKVKELEASLGGKSLKDLTPEQIGAVVEKYNKYVTEPDDVGRNRFQRIVDSLQDETQRQNAEKYASQNWAEKGADHFINGMDNVMVMIGNALYSSGLEGLGSHFRDPYMAERMDANAYRTPTITWADVEKGNANPLYYILEQAGEQLPFALVGGAAAKVGGTVLGEFAGGLLGRKLSENAIKTLAGGTAALNETYLNAGDSYYQMAVERGIAPEKAREMAMEQFSKEILLNLVTDRIEYAPFYKEYKGLVRPNARQAAGTIGKNLLAQQAVQGAQEVGQGFFQQQAIAEAEGRPAMTIGEYIASPEAREDFFGAFAGAMPQSVTASVTEAYNNQQNWERISQSSLGIQPNVFKGVLDGMIINGRPDRARAMLNSYLEDAQRIANDPQETRERREEAAQSVRSINGDLAYVNAYWKEASQLAATNNKPLSQFNTREKYGLQLIAASDAIRQSIPEVYNDRSAVDLANEKRANSLRDAGINLINGEGAVYEMKDANGRSVFTNGEKLAMLVQRPEFKQLVNDGVITGVNVMGDPGIQQIVSVNTEGLQFKEPKLPSSISVTMPSENVQEVITTPANVESNIDTQNENNIENATQISEPLQVPREGLPVQEEGNQGQYQGAVQGQPVQEQLRETPARSDRSNSNVRSTPQVIEDLNRTERTLSNVAAALAGGVREYTSENISSVQKDFKGLTSAKKQALRRMSNAVKAIESIAPGVRTIVTNSEDGFTNLYTQAINRDENGEIIPVSANGFYNPIENTIVLNTSNDDFSTDTVFHESIHPVISEIASRNPNLVNAMFQEIAADPDLNDTFVRRFASRYGNRQDQTVREEAIVEFLARQAANRTFSQRIGDWLTRVLQRLGLSRSQVAQLDLNNYDGVRSLANSLANALQRGRRLEVTVPEAATPETLAEFNEQQDATDEARKVSSAIRLQLGGMTREQRQEAKQKAQAKQADLDKLTEYYENVLDGKVRVKGQSPIDTMRDINTRMRELAEEIADLTAQSQFVVAEQSLKDRVKQKVIDRYARLLDYKKGLEEAGYDFNVSNDFYAGADLWRPRAYEQIKQLAQNIGFDKYRPNSLFGQMNKAGIDFAEFSNYLYALHAPERNAYNREMSQLRVDAAIDALMEERSEAKNDYQRADIDRQIEDIREGRDKDFKVIESGSGMTDEEAHEIVSNIDNDPKKSDAYKEFEEKFRQQVINQILLTKNKYGLIDGEEFEALANGRYKKYVPLKVNESALMGDDQFKDAVLFPQKNIRLTKGIFKSKGAENFTSTSRNSPLVQSVIDLQEDIMKGEANRYRAQIAQSVKDNPNAKVWSIRPARYDYRKGPDGKQIPVAERDIPKNGIEYYDNGKKKYIIIEDNALVNAIKETNVAGAIPVLSHVNKWMRNINTVYNPEFWITNLVRDIQEAGLALGREDIKGIQKKFISNIKNPKLYKGIFEKEGGDVSGNIAGWAQKYADNGGEFSGYTMQTQEEMFTNVEKAYQRYAKSGLAEDGKRLASKVADYFKRTSSTIELASRVSAFKALVESGVPEYKAAEIARNLTVNFDKKGEWGSAINSMYLFANAGIQGTTNLMYGILTKPKYRYIAAGVAALGAIEAISNDMLSDCDKNPEDCYDSIPQDTKNKNIILKNPTGSGFLKIPMPYGWSFFHALGVNGAQYARKNKTVGEATTGSIAAFLDSYNPVQSDDLLQALAPTAMDPIVQLATNTNWMGGKIKPEQIYKAKPESQLSFSNTSGAAKKVAEKLNTWTGGTEKTRGSIDISPATLDYLFETVTGGIGRTASGVLGVGGAISDGEIRRVPFLRKFYESPRRFINLSDLYDMKDEAPRTKYTPYEVSRFKEQVNRAFKAGEIDAKQRKEFLDVMHKTQSAEYARYYDERLQQLMQGITTERYPDKERYENKVSAAKRKATEYAKKKTMVERGE